MHQCIHIHASYVGQSNRFANELQSNNRYTSPFFLRVIYAILNASVILEKNEKRDKRW